MDFIYRWMEQAWSLLLTLGWWSVVGLLLCTGLSWLFRVKNGLRSRWLWLMIGILCGAALPVCNFAVISVSVLLIRQERGRGTGLAFLCVATLLNPAGILLSYAYLGPILTAAYLCAGVALAILIGTLGNIRLEQEPAWDPPTKLRPNAGFKKTFLDFGGEFAVWMLLGILAEAAVLALAPAGLWENAIARPERISLLESAVMGLFRHVCIPDDISLAASLVASGIRPGWAVLFLMLGVCTNLPELFVLWGMAGKKTALCYAVVTILGSIAAALMVELVVGSGFAPQFNLADADQYVALAERFSIRTWMPARVPCTVLLILLACRGFWLRMKKY